MAFASAFRMSVSISRTRDPLWAACHGPSFLRSVDWLLEEGVQVVSMSLGWSFAGPGDGTGFTGVEYADLPGSAVDPERARSFDAWAGEYDRFRPGYPEELFDVNCAPLIVALAPPRTTIALPLLPMRSVDAPSSVTEVPSPVA